MPAPDLGTGRSINPGLMNAHKEARKLFYTGAGSPAKGTILRVTGTDGQTLEAGLATNASAAGARGPLYMLLSEKIADGSTPGFKAGFCKGLMHGVLENQNTNGLSVGDPIYLGVDGAWTATKPTSASVRLIGYVLSVSATTGQILFVGTPMSQSNASGVTPVVMKSKAVNGTSLAFSTSDLGGNYDGRPFVATVEGGAGTFVQYGAWNGSGQLTITLSGATVGRVNVLIGIAGDDI